MNSSSASHVSPILRQLLGVLLLWAAVSKLANLTEFLGSVYAYQLPLPRIGQQAAAVVLPWVELLCGLLLLAGFWSRTALLIVTGLLGLFVLATGQAWLRGLEIACGCFNLKMLGLNASLPALERFLESVSFAFIRNLLLTAVAVWLLRNQPRPTAPATIVRPG